MNEQKRIVIAKRHVQKLRRLRNLLFSELEQFGCSFMQDGTVVIPNEREFWRKVAQKTNPSFDWAYAFYFARSPKEIDPEKIRPRIIFADGNAKLSGLFRCATSFWSVPITQGFGRRIRGIVWDDYHGYVIGIFGLCDPVVALGIRDRYIGWNRVQKIERLYNIMTAYVLGAVPPYNRFLGSKLVALMAVSEEVRQYFKQKYEGATTIIRKTKKVPELVLVDTMGAFGKSAIYTKLAGWKFLGYTRGQTYMHLTSGRFYQELLKFMKELHNDPKFGSGYGRGPNWRWRVLNYGLKLLNIPAGVTFVHGLRRGYYIRPMTTNWREFLLGDNDPGEPTTMTAEEVFQYWRERWLLPRLDRLTGKVSLEDTYTVHPVTCT